MANYNTSFMNETNTIMDLLGGVNTLTGGLFFIFLLLAVFVIVFIMYSGHDVKDVLLVDCFICMILAVLIWGMGYISYVAPAICVIGLFGAMMVKIFTK